MLKRIGLRAAVFATFAVAALAGGQAVADETAPGLLASQCMACHNPAVTSNPIPALGSYEQIRTMMLAFRAGTLPSTIMGRIAKGYTDAEIEALAAEIAAWKKGAAK
jgi:sulfide dehydrogenase cytochrome subunit